MVKKRQFWVVNSVVKKRQCFVTLVRIPSESFRGY